MAIEGTTHTALARKLSRTGVGDVRWTRGFWADRFALCRDTIIPSMWAAMHEPDNSAVFMNLYVAAGLREGTHTGTNWSDGDCYKWMEAAAHVYGITREPEVDQKLDELIDVVAKAQDADGYICTQVQLNPAKERWQQRRHHELYNMGHLMTAAGVHHRVTGKTNFLDVATKLADYLYDLFQPRPTELAYYGWNPSNIMALVDLYRGTGDGRYLELAGIFVDMRGSKPWPMTPFGTPMHSDPNPGDQNQGRVPLREEAHGVGHVVTATYLYAGAADVYTETGEHELLDALERIWTDVTSRKMYVTGGSAALHWGTSIRHDPVHEAFGAPYQLPNATAYNETCATIGNAMWGRRMLDATADAKYADVMEQVVYNGGLSPISLDGKRFFYTNPLRWHGRRQPLLSQDAHERWFTFTCYCCPPQVARTVARMQDWAYGMSDAGVWVHLYGSNRLDTTLADGSPLRLAQETGYPWDGAVTFTIEEPPSRPFAIMLRIPGWSTDARICVNGESVAIEVVSGGYAVLERAWRSGDVVELVLRMPTRMVKANPQVEEVKNHVAVMRGPIVYCLESIDLPEGVRVADVHIPRGTEWTATHEADLLGGVTVVEGEARHIAGGANHDGLYSDVREESVQPVGVRLIPYYAWNNRGVPEMTVWLPLC